MRRRWSIVGIVVALIGSAATGVAWGSRYQPLVPENEYIELGDHFTSGVVHPGGAMQGISVSAGLDLVDDDEASAANQVHAVTSYIDGQHLVYAVGLHNRGRVGVTVTGFELPGRRKYDLVPLRLVEIRVGDRLPDGHSSVVHTRPLHSFTVRSGETRDIVVRTRMGDCEHYDPGSSVTLDSLPIRYRVLGFSHRVTLTMPVRLEVAIPADFVCPPGRPE